MIVIADKMCCFAKFSITGRIGRIFNDLTYTNSELMNIAFQT